MSMNILGLYEIVWQVVYVFLCLLHPLFHHTNIIMEHI